MANGRTLKFRKAETHKIPNNKYEKDPLSKYQLTPTAFLIPELQMAYEIDKSVRQWLRDDKT